jgi:thiol-disulfide isomerase/thioredoxin
MLALRSYGGAAMGRFLLILAAGLGLALVLWNRSGASRASRVPMVWDATHLAALTADLSDADGKPAPPSALKAAKRMLIYFSASWCPPCQAFTPQLVEWYKAHGDAATMPLLFVSHDHDAAAMRQYMSDDHMPWWGVAYGSGSAQALKHAYCGSGIPDLVLLDDHGRVLSDSFVSGRYLGPQQVLTAAAAAAGP